MPIRRKVASLILMPSILVFFDLAFGNSLALIATAYTLTGGFINLITIVIGSRSMAIFITTLGLGYAQASNMVLHGGMMSFNYILRRERKRWLRNERKSSWSWL